MATINQDMLDNLCELIGGEKSELIELIETFLEESSEIVKEMQQCITGKDLDTLRRSAHSMKSSSQDFGAVELSKLNAALESQCKHGWPDNAKQQTDEIAVKFTQAKAELQTYIHSQ